MYSPRSCLLAAIITQAIAWPTDLPGHGILASDMHRGMARRTTKPTSNDFDISKLQFIPATVADRRGPCPALNVAANMGVLPRDGKNISSEVLSQAVQNLYNLDKSNADLIAGGIALVTPPLATQQTITLEDLQRHGGIEHDASISRLDFRQGNHVVVQRDLFQKFMDDGEGDFITLQSMAKTRARRARESQAAGSPALGAQDNIAAYGEASIILNVFGPLGTPPGNKTGYYAPKKMLEQWFLEERLPDGFRRPKEALTTSQLVYTGLKIAAVNSVGSAADYLPDLVSN